MKKLVKVKLIIVFLFTVCFSNYVESQTNFIYGKQFGSDKGDFGYNAVADQFGNVFIAGETKGAIASQSFGKTDGFVSKFDSIGNTIWSKQIGTNEDDKINWLAVDQSGNIFVTGYTNGTFEGKSFGKEDIIVVKFDNRGNIEWQKQFGTDSTDIGNMIYVDFQGNIYVTGMTKGKMDKVSYGQVDCVILKLDNKGNSIWTKQFGTSKYDECKGITGDSESNIFVCGATAGDLAAGNKGFWDSFVGKFTDKGEQVKFLQFGTDAYDMASHIAIDKENNIYIGGSTGGDFGRKRQGEGDSFLSKLDKNFEIIWTQQFGTNKWDGVNGIALNEKISENIIISGCQNWPSCQSFIRMYKSDGSLLWMNNYIANGKNGGTCGKGVCIDNKGNIYHTGGTGGSLFKSIDKPEGDDVFLIKLCLDQSQKSH
jgi:hypothetical protein